MTLPTEAFVVLAGGRGGAADYVDDVTIDAATAEGLAVGRLVVERLNMMI